MTKVTVVKLETPIYSTFSTPPFKWAAHVSDGAIFHFFTKKNAENYAKFRRNHKDI